MGIIKIPIDKGWLPDFLPFAMPEGGLLEAKAVLPYDEYYAPLLQKVNYSSNAPVDLPLSGQAFVDNNGDLYAIIGTPSKLYRLELNKSLTDITRLGAEKVTNGTFADASAWTFGTGWAHDAVNFEADHTPGSTPALEQNISAVAGETYRIVFTIVNMTTGTITPRIGGVNGTTIGANGTYTQDITAIDTGNLRFLPFSTFDGSVDTVSVKKLNFSYTTSSNRWYFANYANFIIATNFNDEPQILKPLFTSANFENMGGTPPKAKYCLLNNEHLIFAYLNEAGTISPKKVRWSALGNMENWTASLLTGAGSRNLHDMDGEITGIASVGSVIAIFSRNAISMGWYSGAPFTFSFATNKINNVGAIPGTIVSVENKIFFWHDTGIYVFDGTNLEQIGMGVRNTILGNLNQNYIYRITTAFDTKRGLVCWAYPTLDSVSGESTEMLFYNYRTKRFTHHTSNNQCIFSMAKIIASIIPSIDESDAEYPLGPDGYSFFVDTQNWVAGDPAIMACRGNNGKVVSFTGEANPCILETGELSNGGILKAVNVRPKIQNAIDPVTVEIGSRFKENDSVSYSTPVAVGSNGYANVRKSGRFLRCRLNAELHGGIAGIEADIIEVGKR